MIFDDKENKNEIIKEKKDSFEFEVLSQSDFEEISNYKESLSSSEFNSLPDEFIPSDDDEIQVSTEFLDDLLSLGPERLIKKLKENATPPDQALRAFGFQLPPQYENYSHVWELIKDILLRHVYIRPYLPHISNTLEKAKELINSSKHIVIITGAGISVAAGLPDFRSEESGLYAQILRSFPQLPCPEAMFDLNYFLSDPRPFFQLCKKLLCEGARPTATHRFIRELEERGNLLMNFTQNIDALEERAGIERVLYCHGSFSSAHCLQCHQRYTLSQFSSKLTAKIDNDDDDGLVWCEACRDGLVKPDIVFFGEPLGEDFHQVLPSCVEEADLLIVIGSSLKVQPVGTIPDLLSPSVPQILINMEPILDHNFDIVLMGDCQETVFRLLN